MIGRLSATRPIAADAFEAKIERAIFRATDLYELDGETAFRIRDGRVETGDVEILRDHWVD